MPKVKLSIDCSGHNASVLLSDHNERHLCPVTCDTSDQLLFYTLPKILKENEIDISDINLIAWGQGPGSFTGIRICATWLQTLSYIQSTKVIPICSLRARAQEHIEQHNITSGQLTTYLSANRVYAYFGQWKVSDGLIVPLKPVSVVNKDELKSADIDLGSYEATALNIDKLSKPLEAELSQHVSPFEIRPNYLFDHFS